MSEYRPAENETRKECCIKCKFFDSRAGFCRFDSPKVILNKDGYYTTVWPKIPCPIVDWCGNFEQIT